MTMNNEGIDLQRIPMSSQNHPAILLAAASSCYDLREHQTAVSILELCVKLEPENGPAHLLLARSYIALDRRLQAIAELKRTLTVEPHWEEAKSLLLWCYTSLKDEEEGIVRASETSSEAA